MYTGPVINVFNLEYLPHCHYREHVDMELMPGAICQTLLRINNSSQGAIYITPSLSANIRHKPHHVNRAWTVLSFETEYPSVLRMGWLRYRWAMGLSRTERHVRIPSISQNQTNPVNKQPHNWRLYGAPLVRNHVPSAVWTEPKTKCGRLVTASLLQTYGLWQRSVSFVICCHSHRCNQSNIFTKSPFHKTPRHSDSYGCGCAVRMWCAGKTLFRFHISSGVLYRDLAGRGALYCWLTAGFNSPIRALPMKLFILRQKSCPCFLKALVCLYCQVHIHFNFWYGGMAQKSFQQLLIITVTSTLPTNMNFNPILSANIT